MSNKYEVPGYADWVYLSEDLSGYILNINGKRSGDTSQDAVLLSRAPSALNLQSLYENAKIKLENHCYSNPKELGDEALTRSGTTVCMAHVSNGHIATLNLGDSRASLIIYDPRENTARLNQLTTDHVPENPDEFERITKQGGQIQEREKGGHLYLIETKIEALQAVTRGTRLTRALGNEWFTHCSSLPDVSKPVNLAHKKTWPWQRNPQADYLLKPHQRAFLLMETDGSHAMLDDEERTRLLTDNFLKAANGSVTAETLAKYFATYALKGGCKDDISSVVVPVPLNAQVPSYFAMVCDGNGKQGQHLSAFMTQTIS